MHVSVETLVEVGIGTSHHFYTIPVLTTKVSEVPDSSSIQVIQRSSVLVIFDLL